jgi:hypothetical protein
LIAIAVPYAPRPKNDRVREGDDAGVPDQKIVACDQNDEDADARRHFLRPHIGKQERREHQDQADRKHDAVDGEPHCGHAACGG